MCRAFTVARGPRPCAPEDKSPLETRPGFDDVVNKDEFGGQYVNIPAQPGDRSRVWGVNSFKVSPTFEGVLQLEVAQQCGHRMPSSPYREWGANSGVWFAVAGPGATATVPGAVPDAEASDEATDRPPVEANAFLLGKVSASRFSNCTLAPSETDDLFRNASQYAERYAVEAGFRRCLPRLDVPNTRASVFEFEAPQYMASPGWLLYEAIARFRLPGEQQVRTHRPADRAPTSQSLRGALDNEGFVYQVAARARALIFMTASLILSPSASYCNRSMIIGVISRALEVCGAKMVRGSAGKTWRGSPGPQRAWEFNAVLDSVAGQFGFGFVANKPGRKDPTSQVRAAGTVPGLCGGHYAFASDCCPWSSADGAFFAEGPVRQDPREDVCEELIKRRHYLEEAYARGVYAGAFKWYVGCPVKFSIGGIVGNRWLLCTPEAASWKTWRSVTANHRNVKLASMVAADERKLSLESLA